MWSPNGDDRDALLIQIGECKGRIAHLEDTLRDRDVDLAVERHRREDAQQRLKAQEQLENEVTDLRRMLASERAAHAKTCETAWVQSQMIQGIYGFSNHSQASNPPLAASFGPQTAFPRETYGQSGLQQQQPPSLEVVPYVRPPSSAHTPPTASPHYNPFHPRITPPPGAFSTNPNPFIGNIPGFPLPTTPFAPLPFTQYGAPAINRPDPAASVRARMAYTPHPSQEQRLGLTAILKHFYDRVESFAQRRVNVPDQERDQQLSAALRSEIRRINQQEDDRLARSLLCTSKSRYILIAKLMLYRLVNFAWRPVLLKGFAGDDDYGNKLNVELGKLHHAMPMDDKREGMKQVSELIIKMTREPGWEQYIGETIGRKADELWREVQPLMPPAPQAGAYEELLQLWKDAAQIGLVIHKKVSWFNVDFPPAGFNTAFNPGSMISRDPNYKGKSPMELAALGLKVRIAWTPVIWELPLDDTKITQQQIVSFSRVLLMQ
ncbi:uncharacterized protein KY384_006674 [Bacidia gigantensis]|uniref:uncharacterized protein n=1 Tax=Bacidia gigantensis TaxID=2732470 RepID=UPI001D047D40|nr:uncharacterized protein KY384_006674 [Bacidia gigantensis]KAG8528985.1 hypothetical protein KY384_006674 [Bacidia gigantensis]